MKKSFLMFLNKLYKNDYLLNIYIEKELKSIRYFLNKSIIKKLELSKFTNFIFFKKSKFLIFYNVLNFIIPLSTSVYNKKLINLLFANYLQTKDSFRANQGYPINNQRTHSNANIARKQNSIFKNYKLNMLKKKYSTLDNNIINTIFLAEQINLLWKLQWYEEWKKVKKQRKQVLLKQNSIITIDLLSMAKKIVNPVYSKQKKKTKEKKKTSFCLGFEPGFTKNLIKSNIFLKDNIIKSKIKVNIFSEVKKKVLKKKKVLQKKVLKKKKKSSWE